MPPGLSLPISPNAVLNDNVLLVDGKPARLHHIEDFTVVAFQTSAMVSTVLAEIFPSICAVPTSDGEVVPSNEEAWGHYSRHTIGLRAAKSFEEQQRFAWVVLQWCVIAHTWAQATGHPIKDTVDFLPIALLVRDGLQAVGNTRETWAHHESWTAVQSSYVGVMARLYGTDEPDPGLAKRSKGTIVPWPTALGIDMGSSEQNLAYVCQTVTDLHVHEGRVTGLFWGGYTVHVDTSLVDVFLQAFEKCSRNGLNEAWVKIATVEGREASFRAIRLRLVDGGHVHVFRRLAQPSPEDLRHWTELR